MKILTIKKLNTLHNNKVSFIIASYRSRQWKQADEVWKTVRDRVGPLGFRMLVDGPNYIGAGQL